MPLDKRKRSLYISESLLKEMQHEARRQDRSLSWIVQQAWKIARFEMVKLPGVMDIFSSQERQQSDIPS